MITIIHGDNIEESRQEFNRLKQLAGDREIRSVNERPVDEAVLVHATESGSLFDKKVLVIMENVFAPLARKIKQIERIAAAFEKASEKTDIVCWEQKELGKEALSILGRKAQLKLFAYPKVIFTFLDAIRMNNKKVLLTLLNDLTVSVAPELVWNMTANRIRLLIQIRSGVIPGRLQSWQLSRLTNQSRTFTMDELLKIYNNMREMEYSLKTGYSPFSMTETIKQWIIEM